MCLKEGMGLAPGASHNGSGNSSIKVSQFPQHALRLGIKRCINVNVGLKIRSRITPVVLNGVTIFFFLVVIVPEWIATCITDFVWGGSLIFVWLPSPV